MCIFKQNLIFSRVTDPADNDPEKREEYDRTGIFDKDIVDKNVKLMQEMTSLFWSSVDNSFASDYNILNFMKEQVVEVDCGTKRSIGSLENQIRKLEKLSERIKFDGDEEDNFLLLSIRERIEYNKEGIKERIESLELGKDMLALLEKFSFSDLSELASRESITALEDGAA